MKELRIYAIEEPLGAVFYEVYEGWFVVADTLLEATKKYQNRGPHYGRDYEELMKGFRKAKILRPDPRELRNFAGDGGNVPFEVMPGHVVFGPSRDWAEQLYKNHCDTGGDPGSFGVKIDRSFLQSRQVADSVFISGYNKYGITLEQDASSHKVVLWQSDYGKPYWEVEPGKLVRAQTPEQAQDRHKDNPRFWTNTVEDIAPFNTGFTGPVPPPSSVGSVWIRRFLDKDGDLAWLLETPGGGETLVYGDSPEAAAEEMDDLDDDEFESPKETMAHYGPMVELFEPGGVSEPFSSWPPPWSFATKVTASTEDVAETPELQAHNEMEMSMKLNSDGTISTTSTDSSMRDEAERTGAKRPMVLETLKDHKGRTWYELPSGKWIVASEMRPERQNAAGAWDYWRSSGFDNYLGYTKRDMFDSYGPMTNPSMEVLDDDKNIELGDVFSIEEHCRCSNRGLLNREQEQEKMIKVGSYTHCIDCGKLRP